MYALNLDQLFQSDFRGPKLLKVLLPSYGHGARTLKTAFLILVISSITYTANTEAAPTYTFTDRVKQVGESGDIQFENVKGYYKLEGVSANSNLIRNTILDQTLTCQVRFPSRGVETLICIFGDNIQKESQSVNLRIQELSKHYHD